MDNENPDKKRFNPAGLAVRIIIEPPPPEEKIVIDGQVVTINDSSIKIKLQEPFQHAVDEAELRISLILPESGVPVSIHGMIKSVADDENLFGPVAQPNSDGLLFECVRFVPHTPIEYETIAEQELS